METTRLSNGIQETKAYLSIIELLKPVPRNVLDELLTRIRELGDCQCLECSDFKDKSNDHRTVLATFTSYANELDQQTVIKLMGLARKRLELVRKRREAD
ncbi:MAG TPA: hypothetical protein VEF33_07520 [Syntrophales bacterium]|nr:hypothetical protein [Syntrophales bacterium]